MADEITVKVYLAVAKTGVPSIIKAPNSFTATMTGTDLILATQLVAEAAAANLEMGAITTPGYGLFHNLDAANFIEIGHDVAAAFEADVKLLAGEWCLFRLAQATPQVKANTADCQLEYFLVEA